MKANDLFIVADLDVAAASYAEAQRILAHHVAASRADEGNIAFDALAEDGREGRFMTIERWMSEDALKRHKATAHYRAFRASIDPLLTRPPADRMARAVPRVSDP